MPCRRGILGAHLNDVNPARSIFIHAILLLEFLR